jgi:hypothetical protein
MKWFEVKGRFPRKGYHRIDREIYEKLVMRSFINAHQDYCIEEDTPVEVVVELYEPPKKSMEQWAQKDLCDSKAPLLEFPDVSDVADIVISSLQSVAYHYKKQVASVVVKKFYGWTDKLKVGIGEFKK